MKVRAALLPSPSWRRVLLCLALILLAGNGPTRAHLLLYENVEVYLEDPDRIRIEFTIHAPELPSAVDRGIDPAAVDASWLPGLDDESLATLCAEATVFIRQNILLEHPDLTPMSELEIAFPTPEALRDSPDEELLPAGCLLGTAWLESRRSEAPLVIGFSPSAEKRLLVSVARPSAFPEVHDIGPGESVVFALPPAMAPPASAPGVTDSTVTHSVLPLWVAGALLAGGIAFLWFFRRRRHPA